MIASLISFTTDALAKHLQNMTAGYTSRLGSALPVDIRRAYSPNAAATKLPEVWVQAEPPAMLAPNFIGDSVGAAPAGTSRSFGLVYDHDNPITCTMGIRARVPVERDDLFDYLLANLLLAVDAASGNTWKQELFTGSGLQVLAAGRATFAKATLSGVGDVYEVAVPLYVGAEVVVSIVTTPILTVTIAPTITLSLAVPFNS